MKEFAKKTLVNRIIEIDVIRGVCILLMVFDHAMFDVIGVFPYMFENYPGVNNVVSWLYRASNFYWSWNVRLAVQETVIFLFFALTGICCSFSRSNVKRGVLLAVVALVISLATHIFGKISGDMEVAIIFGVLHCMSVIIIIIGLLEKIKTDKWIYLALGVGMVIIGLVISSQQKIVTYGTYGFFKSMFLAAAGLIEVGGDTMPMLLYGGELFIGVFIGKWLYASKKSILKLKYHNNPLTFIGRHTIWVFVFHQVVIIAVFGAVLLIAGYKLAL